MSTWIADVTRRHPGQDTDEHLAVVVDAPTMLEAQQLAYAHLAEHRPEFAIGHTSTSFWHLDPNTANSVLTR